MSAPEINKLFNEYCELYYSSVQDYCRAKLCEHPDDADDCVQDAFKVLLTALEDGKKIENPLGFLLKTAGNFINVSYRRVKTERERCVSLEQTDINITYEQDFSECADEKTVLGLIQTLKNDLPGGEYELLKRIADEYDSCETVLDLARKLSKEFSCSETAMHRRMYRLRKKLEKDFKEEFQKYDI